MGKIIDISHHHHVSDWDKVEKNVDVMITKATQGTSFVDDYFETIVNQCEKRKIPYWLYTYLNKGDELAQAKFLVKTCRDKVGEYFVGYILDVEAGSTAAGVKAAMDYLALLDHKMMVYTMYAEYNRYKGVIANRPKKCAWWEARYGLNDGVYRNKYLCHDGVDLHQYTSQGSFPGIPDEIDINRITGYGKSLKWFQTPKNKKEEEAMPEKKEGCFAPIKSPETCDGLIDFLHKRGFGAGEHNLSLIAAANCEKKKVRDALFEIALNGNLIKPDGLNDGWKENNKKD